MKRILTFLAIMLLLCGGWSAKAGTKALWEGTSAFADNDKTTAIAIQLTNCNFQFEKFKITVSETQDPKPKLVLAIVNPSDVAGTWTQISTTDSDPGEREFSWDKNSSDNIAKLTTGGYVLAVYSGPACKISKIVVEGNNCESMDDADITAKTLAEFGGETPVVPQPTSAKVWEGSFDAGSNWDPAFVFYFTGANFAAGDKLSFLATTSDNSQIQIALESSDDTEGFINLVECADFGSKYEYTLTADDAAALNAGRKLRIKGQNYTLVAIDILSNTTAGVELKEVSGEDKPEPVDPDQGYIVTDLTVLSEGHTFGDGWLPKFYATPKTLAEATVEGFVKFYEGDRIRVILETGNDAKMQYGFNDGTEGNRVTGYVSKDDDYYRYFGYYTSDGNSSPKDWIDNVSSTYEIELDQTLADMFNAGQKLVIRGQNITVKGLKLMQPEKRRSYVWIPIFVPNEYPTGLDITGKKVWGYANEDSQENNDPELTAWIGTAKVRKDRFDEDKYVVSFYEEWYDETQLSDDPMYDRKRAAQALLQEPDGQRATHPLRLTRELIPNYARIKVGDMLRITMTARSEVETSLNQESTEAQLGTFDPDKITDITDPRSGYVGITFNVDNGEGKPSDYRNFGTNDDTYVIDYVIDPNYLAYISRYGLSINGRNYDLNSVYAKIYTDTEDYEEQGDREEKDFYYRQPIATPDDLNELGLYHQIQIGIVADELYNEMTTHKYDSKDLYLGSHNHVFDTDQTLGEDEGDEDKLNFRLRFFEEVTGEDGTTNLTSVRVHRAAELREEHFTDPDAPANKPRRAAAGAETVDPSTLQHSTTIMPYNDEFTIETGTTTNSEGKTMYVFGLRVNSNDMLRKVKEHGLELYGQKYHGELLGISSDLTGVTDVTTSTDSIDYNAPYEVYNLQGMRIAEPVKGNLYIVRQNNKVEKVIIR